MFHYQGIKQRRKSRYRGTGRRVRKGWTIPDSELQSWQQGLDDKILLCGNTIDIDQFNNCLVEHASNHVCNKLKRENRYRDPPDIQELIDARRQCGSSCISAKRDISKQINKHRRAAKAEHKELLCKQVANRRWDSKRELDSILESEARTNPQRIIAENGEEFGVERAHEWGDVVSGFWSGVYKDCLATKEIVNSYLKYLCLQVTALVMCLRLESTWQPLFSLDFVLGAVKGLKAGKCPDDSGLVSEVVQNISLNGLDVLAGLFEERAANTAMDTWNDDSWANLHAFLLAKSKGTCQVECFRPIHVLFVLQKVYHRCLYMMLSAYWKITGLIQFGARKGHQALELIHVLRLVVEKSIEWSRPYVIVSLDLRKAFDTLSRAAIIKFVEENDIPLRLKLAILREVLGPRSVAFLFDDILTKPVNMESGLRQGGPDSSFLFALILNSILCGLSEDWKARGLGFSFGCFGGEPLAYSMWYDEFRDLLGSHDPQSVFLAIVAFMDDTYLVASSMRDAQIMVNELKEKFLAAGLQFAAGKAKYMSENCDLGDSCSGLLLDEKEIPRVSELKVLGSVITSRGDERRTYEQRISAAWGCYWRWSHVLECSATIQTRLRFWMLTVGRSLLYGLSSTRENSFNSERLDIVQRNMIRRMMKLKRQVIAWVDSAEGSVPVYEQWVDWQIRSLRRARDEILKAGLKISCKLTQERTFWAGHVGRFDLGDREPHILKHVLLWRPVTWWKLQTFFNGCKMTTLFHNVEVGGLRRWEWHLPEDWLQTANNETPDAVRYSQDS